MNKENMKTQTDWEWKDIEMTNGLTIKDYGCLLISLTNIFRDYLKSYAEHMTPKLLDSFLDRVNGYTENGAIIWTYLENYFGFTHRAIVYPEQVVFSNDPKKYWIIQVPYKNTGHFCNIIRTKGDIIFYFDVYDGKEKSIHIEDAISVREISFK